MPSYSKASAVLRMSTSDFDISAVCVGVVSALAAQPAMSATAVADSTAWPPPLRNVRRLAKSAADFEGSKSMIRSPRWGSAGPEWPEAAIDVVYGAKERAVLPLTDS